MMRAYFYIFRYLKLASYLTAIYVCIVSRVAGLT